MTKDSHAPDIRSQFEELLSSVWSAERNWAFDDLLDLAAKNQPVRRAAAES